MKTSSQKGSFGGGYGINRNTGGASSLPTSVPAYGSVRITPGLNKQMPGSPKSGHGRVLPAKVIGAKK
jgi:hypothetical protein